MIRARRWKALAFSPVCAAALLSLQGCEQLLPEHAIPAVAVAPAQPAAPSDHGDTPASATSIRQGAPLSGTFETDGDIDYFKVDVSSRTLLYVSTDQGNPRHAPTIVSVEGPEGSWSDGDRDVLVQNMEPGRYYIKVEPDTTATSSGAGYDLAMWQIGLDDEPTFDIQLRYIGREPTEAQRAVFAQAAEFWEGALRENDHTIPAPIKSSRERCDDTQSHFGELIDDLLINVQLGPLDGTQGMLAQGGYCIYRQYNGDPGLPIIGIVQFDTADIGTVPLLKLAKHEMAHALGFGLDLWREQHHLRNPTIPYPGTEPVDPPPDTHFAGTHARTEFDAAGGTSYPRAKVPVENNIGEYGVGSLDSHWRESVFNDKRGITTEIMTATVSPTAAVSRVTLGSLEDLGYAVNYDAAEPYRLPGRSVGSFRAASGAVPPGASVPVHDDIYPHPPQALHLPDELLEALTGR